jgi:hypothetical protein
MILQFHLAKVAVLFVFSLHAGIDYDEQNWKGRQLNGQWRRTECDEKSLLYSGNKRGTMHLKSC